jgi:hypothetical protein
LKLTKILLFFLTLLYVLFELAFRFKFMEIAGQASFNPKSVEVIEILGRSISSFGIAIFVSLFMYKRSISLKFIGLAFVLSSVSFFHLQKSLIDNIGYFTPEEFYNDAPEIFLMKANTYNINEQLKDHSERLFNFNKDYSSLDEAVFINLPIYLYKKGNHKSDNEDVMKKHREIYSFVNANANDVQHYRLAQHIERKIKKDYDLYLKISTSFNNKNNKESLDKNFQIFKKMILKKSIEEFSRYRNSIMSNYIYKIHNSSSLRNRSINANRAISFSKFNNIMDELNTFGRGQNYEMGATFDSLSREFHIYDYLHLSSFLSYKGIDIEVDTYNKNGVIHNKFKQTNFFDKIVVGDEFLKRKYKYKYKTTRENTLDDKYLNDHFKELYIKNRTELNALDKSSDSQISEYNKELMNIINVLYIDSLNYIKKEKESYFFASVSSHLISIEKKIENPKTDFLSIELDLLKIQYKVSQFVNKYRYNFNSDINDFNAFFKTKYLQDIIKKELAFKDIKPSHDIDIKNDRKLRKLFNIYFDKKIDKNRNTAIKKIGFESLPLGLDFNSFIYNKEVFSQIKSDYPFLVYGNELLINKNYSDIKDKLISNFEKITYDKITEITKNKDYILLTEYNKANILPIIVLYISTIVLLLNFYSVLVFFLENNIIKTVVFIIFLTLCITPAFQDNEYSHKEQYNNEDKYNYPLTWIANLSHTIDVFEPLAFPFIIALDHAEITYINFSKDLDDSSNRLDYIYYSKRRSELVRKLKALDLY